MPYEFETNDELNDLSWPVTVGECIVLIAGYLIVTIGFGLLAAWILVQIVLLVFKQW